MQIAALGVGLLLLVLGRKLVWLGVAGLGFFFGVACAGAFFVEHSTGVVLLMGLSGGLLGALLAVTAQGAAFAFRLSRALLCVCSPRPCALPSRGAGVDRLPPPTSGWANLRGTSQPAVFA